MRLPSRTLAVKTVIACTAAAAAVAIAGCGPAASGAAASDAGATVAANTPAGGAAAAVSQQQAVSGGSPQPGVAGTVNASSAAPPPTASPGSSAGTVLSIRMTLPIPHPYQRTALVIGHLAEPADGGQPLAGRVVWLERLGTGDWVLFRAHVTGASGNVVFRVHVIVGAAFRLVFRGAPGVARSVSGVRIVP
ncbi:MAG TPA: hypothetical protein VGI58_04150 [Streptosporangiaceae bacterium]